MENSIFKCHQVDYSYRLGSVMVPALKGLTFEVPTGAFFGLKGPSGSGKSTLLNLLGLIDSPHQGEILFCGQPYGSLSETLKNQLRRYRLGFVFQNFQLIEVLTVEENIEYFLVRQKLAAAERRQRVSSVMEKTGIAEHRHKRPNQLSGGQRQRVAIARALAKNPAVIIADEPTASLDSKTGAQVMELLSELNRSEGVTIVLSSHDPKVITYCTEVLTLIDGKFGSLEAGESKGTR